MIEKRVTKNGVRYLARLKLKGRRVSRSFERKEAAEQWVCEAKLRRFRGLEMPKLTVTVDDMWNHFETWALSENRAQATLRTYRGHFYNWIKRFYGNLDMQSVTLEEHREFLVFLKKSWMCRGKAKQRICSATRNRIMATLSSMFSVAIKQGLFGSQLLQNPILVIEKAKEYQKSMDYFRRSEMVTFERANHDNYYYPLLLFMLRTGLRVSETLGFHACQIDMETGNLVIDRIYDASTRSIKMGSKARKIWSTWIGKSIRERIKPFIDRYPEGPIFRKPDGSILSRDYFARYVLPEACQRARLRCLRPHDLRHTFAADFLSRGKSIYDLSLALGHHDPSITKRWYEHLDVSSMSQRMQIMDRDDNVVKVDFHRGTTKGTTKMEPSQIRKNPSKVTC